MRTPRSISLFPAALALAIAPQLTAQTWVEAGDAGSTLATAQAAYGVDQFNLFTGIAGSLQGDVDLYVLQITDPATFTALGVNNPNQSLYLFDEQGRGITGSEDMAVGNPTPSLTGVSIPGPGRYYLAVAPQGIRPVSALGTMWPSGFVGESKPLGAGGREPLSGWTGSSIVSGNYGISFAPLSVRRVLRQVQLPGDHHLSENPNVQGSVGTTAYWPTSGGRFQILYEASELLAAGITGPISLNRLTFRAEDGEVNQGGIAWPYQVTFTATSLTAATMTTSFTTNLGNATTTWLSSTSSTTTCGQSTGATPNNGALELGGATFVFTPYDPTGPRPNLLIDVQLQPATVPAGAVMVAMQDTAGTNLHGRGLVAGSPSATSGTFANPLVMSLEYAPLSGSSAPSLDTVVLNPARNERFGAACGGDPASFYEALLPGQAFDLNGITLTPDNPAAPTRYTVTRGAFPFSTQQLNAAPDSAGDDAVVTRPLGFTFRYPGGSATSIGACTNGYLWLDGTTANADFSPTTIEFLGQTGNLPARLSPCWYDFHCGRNTGIPNSGLHVRTDTSGGPGNAICYITWRQVGVFNSVVQSGTCVHDMQCVLRESTGVVEFRYLSMPRYCANTGTQADIVPALVGFTRGFRNGAPSVDPQTRDLSIEMPFTTGADTTGQIGLTCVTGSPSSTTPYGGRLWAGQQASWRVDNVPAGTLLGVQLLSLETSQPGLQLPTITAPGCMLSTGANVVLWEVHTFPAASVTGTAALTVPAGVEGARLTAQYVVLGGLFGAPDLVTMTSHALLQSVGRQ